MDRLIPEKEKEEYTYNKLKRAHGLLVGWLAEHVIESKNEVCLFLCDKSFRFHLFGITTALPYDMSSYVHICSTWNSSTNSFHLYE